jgi:hypothetical protein
VHAAADPRSDNIVALENDARYTNFEGQVSAGTIGAQRLPDLAKLQFACFLDAKMDRGDPVGTERKVRIGAQGILYLLDGFEVLYKVSARCSGSAACVHQIS